MMIDLHSESCNNAADKKPISANFVHGSDALRSPSSKAEVDDFKMLSLFLILSLAHHDLVSPGNLHLSQSPWRRCELGMHSSVLVK